MPIAPLVAGIHRSTGAWAATRPVTAVPNPPFYQDLAPLYEPLPNVNLSGISTVTETLGWVAAGATAVGIGGNYIYKQLGKKPEGSES